METHRTVLAAAHAAEHELIPSALGHPHVAEALGDFTDHLDQRARLSAVMQRGVRLGVYRPRLWERETTGQRELQSAGDQDEPSDFHENLLTYGSAIQRLESDGRRRPLSALEYF